MRVLATLTNDMLEVKKIRKEIERREAHGQFVAGYRGEGGAYPMRTEEERARRAAASLQEVRILLFAPPQPLSVFILLVAPFLVLAQNWFMFLNASTIFHFEGAGFFE